MLLQATIEIANTERWALELGELAAPAEIASMLRKSAYEVTVVDQFHRVARRYFERAGYRAVWERPFPTGARGRPASVDIALFNNATESELRLELGVYSRAKLKLDSEKLAALSGDALNEYPDVVNMLMLWEVRSTKLTAAEATKAMKRFKRDASLISNAGYAIDPLLASAVDLFVAESDDHRHAVVGLFEVKSQQTTAPRPV
jgi:hypothetical protein